MRRMLYVVLALCLACGGGSSPTAPKCANVAGTWNAAFANSCGQNAIPIVTVMQNGCQFTTVVAGAGILMGAINGNSGTFTLTFAQPCSGTATGTGEVSANSITGTYSGRAIGCCDPVSGAFALTR